MRSIEQIETNLESAKDALMGVDPHNAEDMRDILLDLRFQLIDLAAFVRRENEIAERRG